MIQYLKDAEKYMVKDLYQEAFPDDSASFFAYYEKEVLSRNQVLAHVNQDELLAMLHRNPYPIILGRKEYAIDYIVAVATRQNHRRSGLMRSLMEKALFDMYEEQKPFTYLQPANPKYYEPFEFAFVSDFEQDCLNDEIASERDIHFEEVSSSKLSDKEKELLHEIHMTYTANYDIYALRDEAYMKRLIAELSSEDGKIIFAYHKDRCVGAKAIWCGKEKRFAYANFCDDKRVPQNSTKPYMMARIVHVKEFLSNICLKKGERSIQIILSLSDSVIDMNNGIFLWELDENGSTVIKHEETDVAFHGDEIANVDVNISLTIAQLTSWLFGHSVPKQVQAIDSSIQHFQNVLLDEVV